MGAINLTGLSFNQTWRVQDAETNKHNLTAYREHYKRAVRPLGDIGDKREFALAATKSLRELFKLVPKPPEKSMVLPTLKALLVKVLDEHLLLSRNLSFKMCESLTSEYLKIIGELRNLFEKCLEEQTHAPTTLTEQSISAIRSVTESFKKLVDQLAHRTEWKENTDINCQKKYAECRQLTLGRHEWIEYDKNTLAKGEKKISWANKRNLTLEEYFTSFEQAAQPKELQKLFLERVFECQEVQAVDHDYRVKTGNQACYLLACVIKDLPFISLEVGQEKKINKKVRVDQNELGERTRIDKRTQIIDLYTKWFETCESFLALTQDILLIAAQANKFLKASLDSYFTCSHLNVDFNLSKRYKVWLISSNEDTLELSIYKSGIVKTASVQKRFRGNLHLKLNKQELELRKFSQSEVFRHIEVEKSVIYRNLLNDDPPIWNYLLLKILLLGNKRHYIDLRKKLYECVDFNNFELLEPLIERIPDFWSWFFGNNYEFLQKFASADDKVLERIKKDCPRNTWQSPILWDPAGFLSPLAQAIDKKNRSAVRFLCNNYPPHLDKKKFFKKALKQFREALIEAPGICNELLAQGFPLDLAYGEEQRKSSKFDPSKFFSQNLSVISVLDQGIVVEQMSHGTPETFLFQVTQIPPDSNSQLHVAIKKLAAILRVSLPACITKQKILYPPPANKPTVSWVRASKSVVKVFDEVVLDCFIHSQLGLFIDQLLTFTKKIVKSEPEKIVNIDSKIQKLVTLEPELMAAIYCFCTYRGAFSKIKEVVGADSYDNLLPFFSGIKIPPQPFCENIFPFSKNTMSCLYKSGEGESSEIPGMTEFQHTINQHAKKLNLEDNVCLLLKDVKKIARLIDVIPVKLKTERELKAEKMAELAINWSQ